MDSWMGFVTKLEPGLVLALMVSDFRLFKNLKNNNFIYALMLFIVGLLALHMKQIAGIKIGFMDFSINEIALASNFLILLWTFCFIAFCKKIFNIKINNEKLNKNMNALMAMVLFLMVFSFVPKVAFGTKDKISFIAVCLSLFTCFVVGSHYKTVQFKTSAKYCFSCMLAAATFMPLFLFDIYNIDVIKDTFIYDFVVYLAPTVYAMFFFVFLLTIVENTRFVKEKRIKIQKQKQELLKKQAEERNFKEASEQAHKMKIVEQEKEMEASLLMKMTERGKAIQKIADKASAESESKSGYIAFLSHEVRTPLNGIMGMVRMLANTQLDKKQQEFLDNLNYSGESLLSLLNDVLDYSKLSSGHMELENIGFDVNRFIDNIIVTMKARSDQQGIELVGDVDDKVPAFIKGDPTRLRQVMLNLIGNSIKFTKQGGVYVALKVVKSGDTKCKLRAEVRDTGIGIPDSAKDKLFQEFVQADSSTSRNFGGTGLGLSICKKLISAMGGEIGVISKEGKGSTFWWEAEFDVAKQAEEATEQRSYVATQKDKSYEVLVVEDDQISQQVVGSYLSSNGQLPKFASDGASAIRMIDAGEVDFVFLDMGLPDMNGIEVCKYIRGNEKIKDMPVIALTGNVSEADQKKYVSQGVNFCLGKPVSPEDVQQALFEIFKLLGDGGGDDGSGGDDTKTPKKADEPKEKPKKAKAPKKEEKQPEDVASEDIATMEISKNKENNKSNKVDNILIVEDDLISQKIIEGYLKNDSHTTSVAGTGSDAILAVKNNNFDVILMDINMPEMNGLDATKKIRKLKDEKKANTPIIAITGNVSEEDINNCRKAGMNDFVAKPVDPDYLRGAILRIANTGETSSTFSFESVNKNLEKNKIPVPKHKNPVAVEIPAEVSDLNKEEKGLPYVLVIEDDPISQKIVSEYLVSFKYNPVVADNAEDGLELIDKNNFLAILMDIDLPGMNGLKATQTIRSMSNEIKANTPIIAITGNIKQKDVEACREVGMNDFIGKPINPNYLKGALERNRGSVEEVNLEEDDLNKHLDMEVLGNLKKSFAPEVFQGLMSQFAVSAEEAQKSLMTAVNEGDKEGMKSQAHLLKGMSRNIGLKIVGNFMEAIEKNSQTEPIEDIKDMMVEADTVLEEGKVALTAWFEKWQQSAE